MLTPRQKYEVCRVKSGTALFPINGSSINLFFSTRNGNTVIDWGDGNTASYTPPKNNDYITTSHSGVGHTYSSNYNGNISVKFLQGLRDVYSINTAIGSAASEKLNITDFGAFINQFPNLYSIRLQSYAYQNTADMPVIKGNLGNIPNSVERYYIGEFEVINAALGDAYFNFSSLGIDSKLKHFIFLGSVYNQTNVKFQGDLGKLPSVCYFFRANKATTNSKISYTGKIWASIFDSLYIPLSLTPTETNAMLADMQSSITAKTGDGNIYIAGFRTPASDPAVSYLQGLGFNVNIEYSDRLLMALSANVLDTSPYLNHATIVGTANYTGGALNISTGNYAYIPNKTTLDFNISSLRFGCKVKFNAISGVKGIIGKSFSASIVGRYSIYLESGNILALTQLTAGVNIINSTPATPYNDGNWHTIECVCDRTTGQQKLYIDGILINTTNFTPSNNNITANGRFTIGAYGNATASGILASSELNGAIKDVFVHKF